MMMYDVDWLFELDKQILLVLFEFVCADQLGA